MEYTISVLLECLKAQIDGAKIVEKNVPTPVAYMKHSGIYFSLSLT